MAFSVLKYMFFSLLPLKKEILEKMSNSATMRTPRKHFVLKKLKLLGKWQGPGPR